MKQLFSGIFVEAAGSNESDAAVLYEYVVDVNTTIDNKGIILLPAVEGSIYFVFNSSAEKLQLYNQPGNTVNGLDYSSLPLTVSGFVGFILWAIDDVQWVGLIGNGPV